MKAIFIETQLFEKVRPDYLDETSYQKFQLTLMTSPKSGDVIQGTGGLRKIRWTAKGKGKRSGVRIIYYWLDQKDRFYLLTLYAKNEIIDLKPEEKKVLKQIVEDWKNEQA